MEEDGEVAEMIFRQKIADSRMPVGVEAAVFVEILGAEFDDHADAADGVGARVHGFISIGIKNLRSFGNDRR
jgi:hypothetical protein